MDDIGENLRRYRDMYEAGQLSAEEAWELALPWVRLYNEKAREVAKKYGMKPRLIAESGRGAHIKFVGR